MGKWAEGRAKFHANEQQKLKDRFFEIMRHNENPEHLTKKHWDIGSDSIQGLRDIENLVAGLESIRAQFEK